MNSETRERTCCALFDFIRYEYCFVDENASKFLESSRTRTNELLVWEMETIFFVQFYCSVGCNRRCGVVCNNDELDELFL